MSGANAENNLSSLNSDPSPVPERMSLDEAVKVLTACAKLDTKKFRSERSLRIHPEPQRFEEAASIVASAVVLKNVEEGRTRDTYGDVKFFSVTVWWQLDENHFTELKVAYPNTLSYVDGEDFSVLGVIKKSSPLDFWITTSDNLEFLADYVHERFMFGLDLRESSSQFYRDPLSAYWNYESTDFLSARRPKDKIFEDVKYNHQYPAWDEDRLTHQIGYNDSRLDTYQSNKPAGWSQLAQGMRDASACLLSGLGISVEGQQLSQPTVVEGEIVGRSN